MAGDEAGLPKASINKLVTELVGDLKLTSEVRDVFVACCNEFVQLVSSESAELADKEKKSTITPEHVVAALEALGFSAAAAEVSMSVETWRAEDKTASSKRSKGKGGGGLSDEEALAAQQKLFAEARARHYAQGAS